MGISIHCLSSVRRPRWGIHVRILIPEWQRWEGVIGKVTNSPGGAIFLEILCCFLVLPQNSRISHLSQDVQFPGVLFFEKFFVVF